MNDVNNLKNVAVNLSRFLTWPSSVCNYELICGLVNERVCFL